MGKSRDLSDISTFRCSTKSKNRSFLKLYLLSFLPHQTDADKSGEFDGNVGMNAIEAV